MDWCDINELVYDTVKKIEDKRILQRISIGINPDLPLVKTDKILLGQVINNLVSNATLYTNPGTIIKVNAAILADILQLTVEDNGEGFPPEEIEDVFDKFYRLKSSRPGGTGLGLSIVKGFTEALMGNIKLENVATGGARFTIEIPCKHSYSKV